jgi:two-component system, cell cycle sensor histidine kinase and response regulator CckA
VGADLNDIVVGFRSILNQLIPPAIELKLELSPTPVPVFVDRGQMEQVILNLVVNADSAWLQVVDTGSGIPADVAPNIFEPFFSTKSPEIGTGLGLAIIYGIASQSGGDIYMDSTVDVGTAMTVVLPAREHPPGTNGRRA